MCSVVATIFILYGFIVVFYWMVHLPLFQQVAKNRRFWGVVTCYHGMHFKCKWEALRLNASTIFGDQSLYLIIKGQKSERKSPYINAFSKSSTGNLLQQKSAEILLQVPVEQNEGIIREIWLRNES